MADGIFKSGTNVVIFLTILMSVFYALSGGENVRIGVVYGLISILSFFLIQRGVEMPFLKGKVTRQVIIVGGVAAVLGFFYVSSGGFVAGIPIPLQTFLAVSGLTTFTSVILAPLAEETFTGNLQLNLQKSGWGFIIAAVITSAAFTSLHYFAYGLGNITAFISAFTFSILSCFLRYKSNMNLPSVLVHAIVNASTLSKMSGFTIGV